MSRIDDLIQERCPDGVEFVEIQDLFAMRNGYTPSKSDPTLWTDGTIPWFRMEDIRENGRVLDDAIQRIPEKAVKGGRLFPANSLLVATSATIGEHALITVPHLSNQRFTSLSVNSAYEAKLDMKFVFYYGFVLAKWCLGNTTTSSFPSVDMAGFKRFKFPVPPLEVQREIVRILDQFTQLEAELEAELEARRAQYAHYRDLLLAFPERERVRWLAMSDLGTFVRGRRFTKDDLVDSGIPSMHYGEIYTEYSTSATHAVRHIRTDLRDRLRYAQPGSVVFAGVGETVDDVGKAVAWLGDTPIAVHDDTFVFTSNLNPKYVAYAVQTTDFHHQKRPHVSRAKVKRLSAAGLGEIRIPVPDRAEQDRIVEILDKFDALVSDLRFGIPAEIAARRKQYEYYRDRLLTFEEAAA